MRRRSRSTQPSAAIDPALPSPLSPHPNSITLMWGGAEVSASRRQRSCRCAAAPALRDPVAGLVGPSCAHARSARRNGNARTAARALALARPPGPAPLPPSRAMRAFACARACVRICARFSARFRQQWLASEGGPSARSCPLSARPPRHPFSLPAPLPPEGTFLPRGRGRGREGGTAGSAGGGGARTRTLSSPPR
jgi:hypothetical protein